MRFSTPMTLWRWPLMLLVALASLAPAQQDQTIEPQAAIQARLADQSLMLDVIEYEGGFVAVGERGHVLLSNDGRDWRQANAVPVRATLTRVTSFGRRLWAVGHDAVILTSMDGGDNWTLQHFEPEAEEPLLDVLFITPSNGFAIGAYGRFMATSDAGESWSVERLADRVVSEDIDWATLALQQGDIETIPDEFQDPDSGNPEDDVNKGCYEFGECHLNAIARVGTAADLMIAAERGYGFRSTDRGATWEAFRFPYTGSMFGLVEQGPCMVAFGLRGHIQKSCNFGQTWQSIPNESEATLMGGVLREDGVVVMVGAAATRISLAPDGTLTRASDQLGADYAAVTLAEDGGLIVVGEDGVRYE